VNSEDTVDGTNESRRDLQVGDTVRIRDDIDVEFTRTPVAIQGRTGQIEAFRGYFGEPESVSAGDPNAPDRKLFQITFTVLDVSEMLVDVFEHWLELADAITVTDNSDEHDHDHDGHEHPPFTAGHDEAPAPAAPASAELVSAIFELLVDKGILAGDEVRRKRAEIRARSLSGGARVIARAWTDPAYRDRLIDDAVSAVREVGVEPLTSGQGSLVALPNTEDIHHVIVCTLCSCYPTSVLGAPPAWYKSADYRSRVVTEPRVVLSEFGLELPESVTVRVVDSTADCRYLVIPMRPEGTESFTADELAALITRDTMIGVALPTAALAN
jgi:nitrile hydratase